jgi:hypothetical protein
MQVKTITYTKVLGAYILGFKTMDTHMAEMMNDGCEYKRKTRTTVRRDSLAINRIR